MSTPTPVSNPSPASSNTREEASTPSERPYAWQIAHNLGASFRYAGQGIYYGLRTQRNFRIHMVATLTVTTVGFALQLPSIHIAVIGLTCGFVMALELINTALEAVVDLTVQQ
ncbi:MAG: diacylglycerol kinase family protein, partial [Leptolyngbya sp. SIO1D8]|nr:diacylglycerol kinase family protein [Leptolyngbya sp. SIO1D8]